MDIKRKKIKESKKKVPVKAIKSGFSA